MTQDLPRPALQRSMLNVECSEFLIPSSIALAEEDPRSALRALRSAINQGLSTIN
jgi:hypothetical protein